MNTIKSYTTCVLILFLTAALNLYSQSGSNTHGIYYVNDYGIGTDSTVLQTALINGLIQMAHKNGGGTIFFTSGTYFTGPIKLLSNITVHIDAGARLKFSDNFKDYLPMVESRYEGVDLFSFSPLLYAYKAENISITGRGTIDGQGKKWWDAHMNYFKEPIDPNLNWQKEFIEKNQGMLMPDQAYMFERGFCRPPFIQPLYCSNVLIEGITIVNSPFWTVNPEFCENVTIKGVTILNPDSPNTDGINPSSCKNVHISDCHISVGDDCITIKSGKDEPGRKKGMPAENYTITNSTMLSGHGGVVIGSEMSGDVRNIVISNCIFDGTDRGIRIKSTRGRGGVVEDIRVSNIVMRNIQKQAIMLNLFYSKTDPEPVSERTPQFRDIHISNMTGDAKQAMALIGLPEMPVENITFNDINLDSEIGVSITDSKDIVFNHVTINNNKGPALLIKNSSQIEIDAFKTNTVQTDKPVVLFKDVNQAFVHSSYQTVDAKVFLKVGGESSKEILFLNNYLPGVENDFELATEVEKTAVITQIKNK